MNFYNDICKDACAWTKELVREKLIPDGIVSDTPIQEIKAHELTEFTQCHFFSGVAGWPLAFQLAGIDPDENADSGSCPCQPFSGTGKQMGFADPRHLWPSFRRVINRRRPAKVYGEQVASALGREWLSRVFSDLEIMGYAGEGADLCSAGVGSPNIRQRIYWMGDATDTGLQGRDNRAHEGRPGLGERCDSCRLANPTSQRLGEARDSGGGEAERIGGGCADGGVEHAESDGRQQRRSESGGRGASGGCEPSRLADSASKRFNGIGGISEGAWGESEQERFESGCGGTISRLGYADRARREGRIIRWNGQYERPAGEARVAGPATLGGFWGVADLVFCRDEKWRRIEPGSFPLAHGIPSRVGPLLTELRKLGRSSISLARANRNIRLKGYGNAINPIVAAWFIAASRDNGNRLTPTLETMEVE